MSEIRTTAGSDIRKRISFRDALGDPIAVSSPSVILAERIDPEVVSLALDQSTPGDVIMFIEGSENLLPLGNSAFRIRVQKPNGDTIATTRIVINVQ